jgi:hypothetical protein
VREPSLTESSTTSLLAQASHADARSVLVLSPNSRSNTTRGLFCVGSGVFGPSS